MNNTISLSIKSEIHTACATGQETLAYQSTVAEHGTSNISMKLLLASVKILRNKSVEKAKYTCKEVYV